jgi:hypothetical protein
MAAQHGVPGIGKLRKPKRRLKQSSSVPNGKMLPIPISNLKKLPPISTKIDVKEAGSIGFKEMDFAKWLKQKKESEKREADKVRRETEAAVTEPTKKILAQKVVDFSPLLMKKKKEKVAKKERQEMLRRAKQEQMRAQQEEEEHAQRLRQQQQPPQLGSASHHHKHKLVQRQQWTVQQVIDKFRVQQLDFDAKGSSGGLSWGYDKQRHFIVSVLKNQYLPELHVATALHHHIPTEVEKENWASHSPLQRRVYKFLHIPLLAGETLHSDLPEPARATVMWGAVAEGGQGGGDNDADGEDGYELASDTLVLNVSKGLNRIATLVGFFMNLFPCGNRYFSRVPGE